MAMRVVYYLATTKHYALTYGVHRGEADFYTAHVMLRICPRKEPRV
jgi:hypothetical protein